RRAMPFAALVAIFAVQSFAGAQAIVAFPLYLAVILVVSLQQNRAESLSVAVAAGVALVLPAAIAGQTADLAPAALLAAVIVAVAVTINELTRHINASASAERRRLDGVVESERRLRAMLESVDAGLGIAEPDGSWVLVNERLAAMLGRTRDELLRTTLTGLVADEDGEALENALALLRAGDLTRWSADVDLLKPGGAAAPTALFLGRVQEADPPVPVQAVDIAAHKRADSISDGLAAVRQAMVTSASIETAMPQILEALRTYGGGSAAEYHGARSDSGLLGRVWQSGVLAAEQSSVAVPVVEQGEVVGVIELVSDGQHQLLDDEVTMLVTVGVEVGQFSRRSETAQALRRSE